MEFEEVSDHDYIARCEEIMQDCFSHMKERSRDYADTASHSGLGSKGEFAHLWRKIHKLKGPMWDGKTASLAGEQPLEILMDLFGHVLLALDCLAAEERDAPPPGETLEQMIKKQFPPEPQDESRNAGVSVGLIPQEFLDASRTAMVGKQISPELRDRLEKAFASWEFKGI